MKKKTKLWYVYLLVCADNTIYCGITTDIFRREHEHNHLTSGAKYTKARRPVHLVWYETCRNRSEACKLESKIKKLRRSQKQVLIYTGRLYADLNRKDVFKEK